MAYEKLLERSKIGSMKLKNRVVMPAMAVSLAQPGGEANENIIAYYEERAKGGVGLIITEIVRVEPKFGTAVPNQLGAYALHHIPHLEHLVDRVHKYGTKILLQLQHPGRENKSDFIEGRQIVAPSPVMDKTVMEMPRELTTDEVTDLVKAFIKAAVFAKIAGADGIELHAAHGYLLNEFLSPYTNKRTDRYGGSFDNRIRIMEEIITGIRYMCGKDFVISVRISADEFVEGGLKLEDSVKIARVLESFGIDVINVSAGIYESSTTIIEPASFPQGWKKYLGAEIKKHVKIPVIAADNIKEPDVAEKLLEEGDCDFVALGRAHLADPEWVNKTKSGRVPEINRCIGCLYCFQTLSSGGHTKCAVNPRCGAEVDYRFIEKDGDGRKVAIIGGGPAGMYAALELKRRGYEPVIFEKSDKLGGQLNLADRPIMKEKLGAYKDSLVYRTEHSGIDIRLNTEATVDNVKAIDPVGVFVATGGTPLIPNLPGIDSDNVMTAEDVLTGKKQPTGKVVVVGGGITGMETAETIASKGNSEVTLVEMTKDIGSGLYASVKFDFMKHFNEMNVKVITNERLMAVMPGKIMLMNSVTSQPTELDADAVVLALGVTPDEELNEKFEEAFDGAIVVGDALHAGRIAEASQSAYSRATTF